MPDDWGDNVFKRGVTVMVNAATCSLCCGKGRIVILSGMDADHTGPPEHAEWRPCPKCVTNRWLGNSRDIEVSVSTRHLHGRT